MIDREIFDQIGLDSGALTLLGTVVHQLERPGTYRLSVQQPAGEVADTLLEVTDDASSMQITVDLADVDDNTDTRSSHDPCGSESEAGYRMRPGGYVVFHVGGGSAAYAAVLAHLGADEPEVAFDSRSLQAGDRFVATVLRPGRYIVTNVETGVGGRLEVSYPGRGTPVEQRAEPIQVTVTERSFRPARVTVKPAQPVIYLTEATARIQIELDEPYDS